MQEGKGEVEMARAVTSCSVVNGTVYIYDENGGLFDVRAFSGDARATAFGSGVTVISGGLCYTYMLQNGQLVQTGVNAV